MGDQAVTHRHRGRPCHLNGCDRDQMVPVECPACVQVIGFAPKGGIAQSSATWDKIHTHLTEGCDPVSVRKCGWPIGTSISDGQCGEPTSTIYVVS